MSTTQRKSHFDSSISSSSRPSWRRSSPSTFAATCGVPATNKKVWPGSRQRASSSSSRNFAIGELISPSDRKTMYARPFAPQDFACASSACTSVRESSRGTLMYRPRVLKTIAEPFHFRASVRR
jgi:hypothetical protein